ncbi:MAG: helix-hairpin-helix domain-containing protein [Bacteroidetes bacterium]|nr:helix-hairpin-helix domain-containing protein [Bacteroidota bacterium]
MLVALLAGNAATAQEEQRIISTLGQQLESSAEAGNADIKNDAWLQQLEDYIKQPLDINAASAEQLETLHLLTPIQLEQLLSWRRLIGPLVSLYELQAIPHWDIATIRRLLPYIRIGDEHSIDLSGKNLWRDGRHSLLLREGRVLEKAKGYDTPAGSDTPYYRGSRDKLLLRYRYNYKNRLQWGFLADKDAGERIFDFYSFHLFARLPGLVKNIALGDFTIQMGQGLIQWQGFAFTKSADVLAIKRQSPVLRPYNAAGEYNFHRGIAVTLAKDNWESTLFLSSKKTDATALTDSAGNGEAFSSFRTAGYHRSAAEIAGKNNIRQNAAGASFRYKTSHWHAGGNIIAWHFSLPMNKSEQLYNLLSLQGRSLLNASIDYACTLGNLHIFGEAAADGQRHSAFIQGVLLSPDPAIDISLLYRHLAPGFQSLYANAFTQNSTPANETGLYTGIAFRPAWGFQLSAYADIFPFPWLRYRVSAPSAGSDYLLQLAWTGRRETELSIKYKEGIRQINRSDTNPPIPVVAGVRTRDLRLQYSFSPASRWTLTQRLELDWYDTKGTAAQQGFMAYTDAGWHPLHSRWKGSFRLQYFETGSYDTRIYAMESDMAYHYSIPAFYDKGFRYYINAAWQPWGRAARKRWHTSIGLRWAQTLYRDKDSIGDGQDATSGGRRTEATVQLLIGG